MGSSPSALVAERPLTFIGEYCAGGFAFATRWPAVVGVLGESLVRFLGLFFGSSGFYNRTIATTGPKAMNREYDLFERLRDDSVLWRGHVSGLESARLKLTEIVKETENECFVMHLPTKEIVIRMNLTQNGTAPPPKGA